MKQTRYKDSGVDIAAGNALIDLIKPAAKATTRAGCMGGLGGFGAFFDPKAAGYIDPVLVSATDGVGTKLRLAIDAKKLDTVGIDLVAMCVNDLIVQGAEPLFFLDYFATGKLDTAQAATVINGIALGCRQSNCALIGGETAEMPGMYHNDDFDLAGFAVGAVERDRIITGQNIKSGDVILGLASSGVHSNGFSLVRYVLKNNNIDIHTPSPFSKDQTIADILLTPTKLYIQSLLPLVKNKVIKGLAHITGGGLLENIPRVLPDGLGVELHSKNWQQPPVFEWLQTLGNIPQDDMYRTFNCGIGMVIIVDKEQKDSVIDTLRKSNETVFEIGLVTTKSSEAVVITP